MPKPCADNHTAALSQRRAALLPNPYPIKIGNRFYSAGQVNHQSYRRRPKSRDIRRLVSHRDGSRLPGNRTESKERQMLSQMANATMRIAVAGTNSLALMISHQIITQTSHQLIILTRHVSASHTCLIPSTSLDGSLTPPRHNLISQLKAIKSSSSTMITETRYSTRSWELTLSYPRSPAPQSLPYSKHAYPRMYVDSRPPSSREGPR